MPFGLRVVIAICCAGGIAALLPPRQAAAQVVLTGFDFSFEKSNGVDPSLAENQDRITTDVWIARGGGGGVFNAAVETGFPAMDPSAISPALTQWATDINNPGATIGAAHWESLTFDTWLNAYGGTRMAGPNTLNRDAVLRIVRDDGQNNLPDIYLDIRFTEWGIGSDSFSYLRSSSPTGDYNGDGDVNAADYTSWRDTLGQPVTTPGDAADGNLNGVIDVGDYAFWKIRYGSNVPLGGGQLANVPEPSCLVLSIAGLLVSLWHPRQRAKRRCRVSRRDL